MNKCSEYITGAKASFSALRLMEQIADYSELKTGDVITKERYFRDLELAKSALINSAGPLTPFLEGFIATVAEFMTVEWQDCAVLNLYKWRPESVMSESEINAHRAELFQTDPSEEEDEAAP
jgi:hypothetical protein